MSAGRAIQKGVQKMFFLVAQARTPFTFQRRMEEEGLLAPVRGARCIRRSSQQHFLVCRVLLRTTELQHNNCANETSVHAKCPVTQPLPIDRKKDFGILNSYVTRDRGLAPNTAMLLKTRAMPNLHIKPCTQSINLARFPNW